VNAIIRVRRLASQKEIAKAFAIRMRVFVKEQGVPAEIELDSDDDRATHFLAYIGSRAVGTARVVRHHGSAKIGRMAVLKSYRGRGIGKKLLERAMEAAKKWGARKIYLHAQVAVIGFYESMGFRCTGPIFDEAGIAHRKMILKPPKAVKGAIRRRSAAG
jgi:predicted GNAT family N-acyltransferase